MADDKNGTETRMAKDLAKLDPKTRKMGRMVGLGLMVFGAVVAVFIVLLSSVRKEHVEWASALVVLVLTVAPGMWLFDRYGAIKAWEKGSDSASKIIAALNPAKLFGRRGKNGLQDERIAELERMVYKGKERRTGERTGPEDRK
jgi:hypothetical protein